MELMVVVVPIMPHEDWMTTCGGSQQVEIASFKVERIPYLSEAQFDTHVGNFHTTIEITRKFCTFTTDNVIVQRSLEEVFNCTEHSN